MSQPRSDEEDDPPGAFSQGSMDIPSFSQESIELGGSASRSEEESDDVGPSLSQVQTLSQDMRDAGEAPGSLSQPDSLSQGSQSSYIPSYSQASEGGGGGSGDADPCRATLCFRPLGPDVHCEPPVGLERCGSLGFTFSQRHAGPFQLVECGWEGPGLASVATIELPRQLVAANNLQHVQLVLPALEGWDFRALIVTVGRHMYVWPNYANARGATCPDGTAEFTFKVEDAHRQLDDRRRRKNYISMPCFGEVGPITSTLAHYLDTYPGFSWKEAWVDELGYSNSGRVLRFEPTGGATTELKWPVDSTTVLRAGAYELSMYILVDDGYETLPMFRASFELENERFGKHTLFTGCRGTRLIDPKAERRPGTPGYWQRVTATVTLPSDALAFDFTIIGAGKMGQGGFLATGLSLHQVGKKLQVAVQQIDGRQIINRDTRLAGPPAGGATIHSMEMSLLGQECVNGMRRASFNMTVGYNDVAPNVDDDSLLVRFSLLWKPGVTGKDQLMAEHLNPAYYNKRIIRTSYHEDLSAEKPTGLAGFDQVVLHARDRPGATRGLPHELYVMRRHVILAAESGTGMAEEQLQVVVDNLFEPCGDARIDSAHQAARARGECIGYTRLGKLKVLGIDLWSSCGLWPSKKATHKGGLKKAGSGGTSPGVDPGGFGSGDRTSVPILPGGPAGASGGVFLPSSDGGGGGGPAPPMDDPSLQLGENSLQSLKRKVDELNQNERDDGRCPPDMPRDQSGNGNGSYTEGGTFPGRPSPVQPPLHKIAEIWKFPAKRVLLQVDLPARFWDDDRGTRLYVDFRSQESKDTKRHRDTGAIGVDILPVKLEEIQAGGPQPHPPTEPHPSDAMDMASPGADNGSAINALTALAGVAI